MSTKMRLLTLGACWILGACDSAQGPNGARPNAGSTGTHGSGETNGPGTPGSEAVTMPHCKRVEELLPNADTPVGTLVPRQIALGITTTSKGTWKENKTAPLPMVEQSITPSADNIQGQLDVAYANGAVRLVKNEYVGCTPGAGCADIAVTCVDAIEIDMQVSMNSDNGVFAETWTGVLSIPDPRDPDLNLGEPQEPNPEPVPGIPKEFFLKANIDPIVFNGTATMQVGAVQPGFKLVRHQMNYSVKFVDNTLNQASISTSVTIQQDPLPGDGSGVGGAGFHTFYTFEPGS